MTGSATAHAGQNASWRGLAVTMIVATSAFVVALVLANDRPADIVLTPVHLSVGHGNIATTVQRSEIQDVQLLTKVTGIGWKRSGFSGGTVFHGRFVLRGSGDALLFLDTRKPPFIRLRSPSGVVVFGAATSTATRALFDSLRTTSR